MAKGFRGRRRIASRHYRTTPYRTLTCGPNSPNEKKSTTLEPIKDWEDITCSVCMEYPHNAVLLLCSSHDKGCRPYMCGTSSRYSNCLDQYKNAYIKEPSPHHSQPLQTNGGQHFDQISGWPVEKYGELTHLACPLCRGQVKGWTVVESAREFFNTKKRSCVHDKCSFVGVYKELKKHVRSEHLSVNPREVDPDQEQKWRQLERERERDDVISTITSSMPGSMVFGDYVIEGNPYGVHSDNEEGLDTGLELGIHSNLVNVLLLFHAFGPGGRRDHDDDVVVDGNYNDDDDDNDGGGDDDNNGMLLVNRFRRQGRVLLGRSGRRRQNRLVNRGQSQTWM